MLSSVNYQLSTINFLLSSLLAWYQFEIRNPEPVVDDLTPHGGFPDGIAKAIIGMGIAMFIYAGAINKIGCVADTNRQVAAVAF